MIRGIAQVRGKRIRGESFGLHFNEADDSLAARHDIFRHDKLLVT